MPGNYIGDDCKSEKGEHAHNDGLEEKIKSEAYIRAQAESESIQKLASYLPLSIST